jgi:hypothetical protein
MQTTPGGLSHPRAGVCAAPGQSCMVRRHASKQASAHHGGGGEPRSATEKSRMALRAKGPQTPRSAILWQQDTVTARPRRPVAHRKRDAVDPGMLLRGAPWFSAFSVLKSCLPRTHRPTRLRFPRDRPRLPEDPTRAIGCPGRAAGKPGLAPGTPCRGRYAILLAADDKRKQLTKTNARRPAST